MDLSGIRDLALRLREQVGRVVLGQKQVVDLLLVALLSEGHVLLEGVPGTAKTLLGPRVRRVPVAASSGASSSRPTSCPATSSGTNLFDFRTNEFHLVKGPDLHGGPARRRDQPHAAEDAGRAAPGHAGAHGHDRRGHARARRGLHRGGDAEPDRAGGHLPAARGPARPLPVQGRHRLPVAGRGARDGEAARAPHGHAVASTRSASSPSPTSRSCAPRGRRSREIRLSDEIVDYVVDLVRATRGPARRSSAAPRRARRTCSPSRAARSPCCAAATS